MRSAADRSKETSSSMKTIIIVGYAIAAVTLVTFAAGGAKMKMSSSAFQNDGTIPEKFSKNDQNVNPELRIEGVPAEAKSLALIVDDPDAPVGLFTHWLVWNIDPKTSEIAEKSVPKGALQGTNDFPGSGYDGPQPPSGTHRYYFKIFALDRMLDLKSGAKRREVDAAMRGHVIAQGEWMGRYSKK
jgi:Raf kinase inhibitor-like YbhB/YbcL family protein